MPQQHPKVKVSFSSLPYSLYKFFFLYRPTSEVVMNDIVKVMKKYEDEFDVIHGLGKLEIFDELLQGNEAERDRNLSISATYESAIPLIKVGNCDLQQILG